MNRFSLQVSRELSEVVLLAVIIMAMLIGAAAVAAALPFDAGTEPEVIEVVPADAGPTATDVAKDPPPAEDLAAKVLSAIRSGKWGIAFGAGLMVLVLMVRRFGAKWIPWFTTRKGGYALAFGTAAGLVIGAGMSAGGSLSVGLIAEAIGLGFAMVGMHTAVKDVRVTQPTDSE